MQINTTRCPSCGHTTIKTHFSVDCVSDNAILEESGIDFGFYETNSERAVRVTFVCSNCELELEMDESILLVPYIIPTLDEVTEYAQSIFDWIVKQVREGDITAGLTKNIAHLCDDDEFWMGIGNYDLNVSFYECYDGEEVEVKDALVCLKNGGYIFRACLHPNHKRSDGSYQTEYDRIVWEADSIIVAI